MLLSLALLAGCFSTHLLQDNNVAELQHLVTSTQRNLALEVGDSQRDSSRGYQFLLGIVPIARIFTDNIYETVVAKLQFHAGKDGLGLPARSGGLSTIPRLHVTIVDVTLNGYDLVIVRLPAAHIALRGILYTAGGGEYTCEERGSDSALSRFAFSSDLNQVLESAVDSAAAKLLRCLGLSGQQPFNEPIARSYPIDSHGSL